MKVDRRLYPIKADASRIFFDAGFGLRSEIVWVKPEGYGRPQRQSAVAYQHPYPMYPYFTNITESILLFEKEKFDYRSVSKRQRSQSRFDGETMRHWLSEWSLDVWYFNNVMPVKGRLEEGVAAFPDELPRRLIELFSYKGETILDMFARVRNGAEGRQAARKEFRWHRGEVRACSHYQKESVPRREHCRPTCYCPPRERSEWHQRAT